MFIECVSASSLSCELIIYSLALIMQVISGHTIMRDIWILMDKRTSWVSEKLVPQADM